MTPEERRILYGRTASSIQRRDGPVFRESPNPHSQPLNASEVSYPEERRPQAPVSMSSVGDGGQRADYSGHGVGSKIWSSGDFNRGQQGYDAGIRRSGPVDSRGYAMPVIDLRGHSDPSSRELRESAIFAQPARNAPAHLQRIEEWANADPNGSFKSEERMATASAEEDNALLRWLASESSGGQKPKDGAVKTTGHMEEIPEEFWTPSVDPAATTRIGEPRVKADDRRMGADGFSMNAMSQNRDNQDYNYRENLRGAYEKSVQDEAFERAKNRVLFSKQADDRRLAADGFSMVDEHGGSEDLDVEKLSLEDKAKLARAYADERRAVRDEHQAAIIVGRRAGGNAISPAEAIGFEEKRSKAANSALRALMLGGGANGAAFDIPVDHRGLSNMYDKMRKK